LVISGSGRVVKVVILAGGLGTRLSEETASRPKPMVEIGERPILWHIMKSYSHYGVNDFVVCLGYKGYVIKEYFSNYFLHMSDVTFDMSDNSMQVHQNAAEPWRVTLVDTGAETQTGGRIRRVGDYVRDDTFMLTYGDGVADVDIAKLLEFHQAHGKLATITAVQPLGRFGALQIDEDQAGGPVLAPAVRAFQEKPVGDGAWVNGGFFVLEPAVLDRLGGDDMPFESAPLEGLAAEGELRAFRHRGFWQPMDALRDVRTLEALWASGEAPWAVWNRKH
jgi:glucose-1-phosphate cytidylyltransferase